MSETIVLTGVIFLSLLFIYTDGFQVGSSIPATAIGCRAMTPAQAVGLAAVAELAGALLGGSAVALSVRDMTNLDSEPRLLFLLGSGLLSAIAWNFLTRALRQPSSSTHALFGGLVGALYAGAGDFRYVQWGAVNHIVDATGLWRIILSLLVSPVTGAIGGYIVLRAAYRLLARASTRINRWIKGAQWLTVTLLAFSHGANDSQKAMGVIILALAAAGGPGESTVPLWVRLAAGLSIAAGVASIAPGLVKKVGNQLYRLKPIHGFATQIASASIILTASLTGGPVSATQVISSTVVGVGSAERIKGVHWIAARQELASWLLTMPATALIACLIYGSIFRGMTVWP